MVPILTPSTPLSTILPEYDTNAMKKNWNYQTVGQLFTHYPRCWKHRFTDETESGGVVEFFYALIASGDYSVTLSHPLVLYGKVVNVKAGTTTRQRKPYIDLLLECTRRDQSTDTIQIYYVTTRFYGMIYFTAKKDDIVLVEGKSLYTPLRSRPVSPKIPSLFSDDDAEISVGNLGTLTAEGALICSPTGQLVSSVGSLAGVKALLKRLTDYDKALLPQQLQGWDQDFSVLYRYFSRPYYPIYAARRGTNKWLFSFLIEALMEAVTDWQDPLPSEYRRQRGLVDIGTALWSYHWKNEKKLFENAVRRLQYDEALSLEYVLKRAREEAKNQPSIPFSPDIEKSHLSEIIAHLPFSLFPSQEQALHEIIDDMAGDGPMRRLLQAETSAGKTLVAALALCHVAGQGYQGVLLAPTTALARQHAQTLQSYLHSDKKMRGKGGVSSSSSFSPPTITLLTGDMTGAEKKQALLDIVSGESSIIVGTHALLSKNTQFFRLGLVVIDEQHRFGVKQRQALEGMGEEGKRPHFLSMTATPNPRTTALLNSGCLDVSRMEVESHRRQNIQSYVVNLAVNPSWVDDIWRRILEEVHYGNQVFIVSPSIKEGATMGVEKLHKLLSSGPLSTLRLACMHSKIPDDQKEKTFQAFYDGQIDVMVSTSLIEVGIDVPDSTMMVIWDADCFGSFTLHQLRGRVGRRGQESVCLFVLPGVLGRKPETTAKIEDRLQFIARTTDGNEIALYDRWTRGEGDLVMGTAQSGYTLPLRFYDPMMMSDLAVEVQQDATAENLLTASEEGRQWAALVDRVQKKNGVRYGLSPLD